MEIKISNDIIAATRAELHGRVARPSAPAADRPSFEGSQRLDQALASVPDIRPEVVERARNLVSLVQYPPAETMRKLARLLAIAIERNS